LIRKDRAREAQMDQLLKAFNSRQDPAGGVTRH